MYGLIHYGLIWCLSMRACGHHQKNRKQNLMKLHQANFSEFSFLKLAHLACCPFNNQFQKNTFVMKNSTFEVYKEHSVTQSGQDFLLLKGKKKSLQSQPSYTKDKTNHINHWTQGVFQRPLKMAINTKRENSF